MKGLRGMSVLRHLAAAAVLLAACSRTPLVNDTGGSGSTTTNGIVVAVYTAQGAPAAGCCWRLRSSDYVAGAAAGNNNRPAYGSTVGASGELKIDSVDSGAYVLEVNDGGGYSLAVRFFAPGDGRTLALKDTLKPSCRLLGNVPSAMRSGKAWFVQIYGLERLASVDPLTGGFAFTDIPAGIYSLRFVSTSAGALPIKMDGVAARAGDALLVSPFSAWRFSRTLILNTTRSGAGIAGEVLGFPALVRLDETVVDFAQTEKDGADIRFTKQDGTPLPLEIERWDKAARRANIWVRIDTVHADDDAHAVIMFWGNAGASAVSNGAAVFDTADGFCGVWHMNANCDDATYFSRSGTASGLSDTVGIIGSCLRFGGNGYAKVSGLMGMPPALTLSAWAYLDTVKNTGAEIVSIGDAALIRMDDHWNDKGTHGAYCVRPDAVGDSTHCFTKSGVFLKKTGWHFLSYSIDVAAGVQRLYIDGSPCCVTESTVPIVYGGIGGDVYFGRHGNGKTVFNFEGGIDEVRMSRNVRSADWIRLSYLNQRPDDKLVKWK